MKNGGCNKFDQFSQSPLILVLRFFCFSPYCRKPPTPGWKIILCSLSRSGLPTWRFGILLYNFSDKVHELSYNSSKYSQLPFIRAMEESESLMKDISAPNVSRDFPTQVSVIMKHEGRLRSTRQATWVKQGRRRIFIPDKVPVLIVLVEDKLIEALRVWYCAVRNGVKSSLLNLFWEVIFDIIQDEEMERLLMKISSPLSHWKDLWKNHLRPGIRCLSLIVSISPCVRCHINEIEEQCHLVESLQQEVSVATYQSLLQSPKWKPGRYSPTTYIVRNQLGWESSTMELTLHWASQKEKSQHSLYISI